VNGAEFTCKTPAVPEKIKNIRLDGYKNVCADWEYLADVGRRLESTQDRIEPNVLRDLAHHKLQPLKAFARRLVGA
jgi:hypothetical protein